MRLASSKCPLMTQSGHYRYCADCSQCGRGPGDLAISPAGIVARIQVFEAQRTNGRYLGDVLT